MAHAVVRRTNEIGIRMALGAERTHIIWMVLKESLLLVGVGLAVGVPAAWGAAQLISNQLFGLSPSDPLTLLTAVTLLTLVAALAGYLPARKASRVNPLVALRYECTLLKKPGFTLIAVMTLALGIGASTAIFTVVDAALLRGLPYKSPERLYHLWESTPQKEFAQREFSYPDYQDYQKNQVLEGIAAYTGGGAIMSGRGEPERVLAPAASANFFSLLGVEPVIGRTFQPGEDKPGAPRVTVLTYGMWQRRFGGDQGIVGQSLTLNGDSYTVIGVLPASFQFALRPADLWRPYQPTDAQLTRRFMHGTNLIGRLKPGVSVAQAQTELSVIASRIEQENKESHAGTGLKLVPLQEQVVGQVKPILLVLLAAVGFVLLIACANVASLLLTRSLARQKEIAIRAALGASRWRVIRQLLTESLLLSLAGGVAGLLIAYWSVGGIVAIMPASQLNALPFLNTLHIDGSILAFSFGLSLLTGIVFGLAPALQSSRLDLNEVLKEGGRNTSGGAGHRLRSALVMTEIALAVVLLVGAGLMMMKSLLRLLQANVGFNPQNVLTMTVVLPACQIQRRQQAGEFLRSTERTRAVAAGRQRCWARWTSCRCRAETRRVFTSTAIPFRHQARRLKPTSA